MAFPFQYRSPMPSSQVAVPFLATQGGSRSMCQIKRPRAFRSAPSTTMRSIQIYLSHGLQQVTEHNFANQEAGRASQNSPSVKAQILLAFTVIRLGLQVLHVRMMDRHSQVVVWDIQRVGSALFQVAGDGLTMAHKRSQCLGLNIVAKYLRINSNINHTADYYLTYKNR